MNEIIKITEKDGRQIVSARELYDYLEYHKGQFARWAKQTITNNQFASEGDDWVGVNIVVEGNHVMDYALSLSFAKKITMLSQSVKGNRIREYFIECERLALTKYITPKDLSRKEILLLALEAEERAEKAQKLLDEAKPKVDFYDEVTESKDVLDFGQVAKLINKKGFGRNNLFEFLRNKKVLMHNNNPYQSHIDNGYFKMVETRWTDRNGDTKINIKTVVFQKGVDYILRLLKKEGIE
jgi:anti-repressor protein